MANKKKPSLFLIPNHHSFEEPGVPFTEEMLQWPIHLFSSDELWQIERNRVLRNALMALSKIHPFHAKVSFGVDLKNKNLQYPKRTWGKLFLEDENVLTFSHHSQKTNAPFSELGEWVEMEDKPWKTEKELKDNWQNVLNILAQWTVNEWIDFFQKKLIERGTFLSDKSDKIRADADALRKKACIISSTACILSFNKE